MMKIFLKNLYELNEHINLSEKLLEIKTNELRSILLLSFI